MSDETVVTETKTETQEPKQEQKPQQDWDKTKQAIDQLKANVDKATQERDKAFEQMGAIKRELDEFKSQMSAKERAVAENDLDKLASYDPTAAKVIRDMEAKLAKVSKVAEELGGKVAEYEKVESEKALKAQKDSIANEILGLCDEDYGAEFRNEAVKMADEMVNKGERPQPSNYFQGIKLMRECYKAIKEKSSSAKKTVKAVSVDTGAGGVSVGTNSIKPGTRQEILSQMRRDTSWKNS